MNDKLKSVLTYGMFAALISLLFSVILYVTDFILLSLWSGILIFIMNFVLLTFVLAFFGRKVRNQFSPDSYKYGAALKDSVIMVLVITVIAVLYNVAFLLWIEPGYEERIMVEMTNKVEMMMYDQGLPQSQIDKTINEMMKQPKKSILKSSLGALSYSLISGVICALIAAAFVKKKNSDAFGEAMGKIENE